MTALAAVEPDADEVLAVRQRLIELGLEAAGVQTVGFGNDFSPSGPSSDVVVIYRQN